jgi:PIN domain nuclease of toxin-antitoxin system
LSGAAGLILDSSALLAAVLEEPGGEAVELALAEGPSAFLASVNFAEAIAVLVRLHGMAPREARDDLLALGVTVLPFGAEEAEPAAILHAAHRGVLSLGDAACLATAMVRGLPVLTADRAWAPLGLPVEVRLVR